MSREAKLVEALSVALRQWEMYANDDRQYEREDIEDGKDGEAELYRMCLGVLKNAKDKA